MPITIEQIHEGIHAGARAANEKYTNWSKGLWLNDSGSESLLVCEIAEQFYQAQSDTERLRLELSFRDILDILEVRNPGGINRNQRVDIALLNRDSLPKFIIEVKRTWSNDSVRGDLDRIRSLLRKCSLNRGFLAVFMAHRVAYKDMRRKIEDRIKFVKKYGNEDDINVRITKGKVYEAKDEDGRLWQSSSLSIEMRR